MNKEEVLERSRNAGQDEGMIYAENEGAKRGYLYLETVGLPLLIFAYLTRQFVVVYAIFTLYSAYSFGQFLTNYQQLKQKRYLVGAILFGAISGVIFGFLFVRGVGVEQGWWG
jgi:hypothetical protein